MEGQTSIKSLAEQNLRGIAAALDEFKDDEEYWRLLVDQLPRGTFRSWEVERFAAATLQDRSPSLLLLQEVQQRQLVSTIEELVIALDRIGCHRALNVLALKSEVVVTQHPSDCMVRQGGRIQLYCKAECKPHGPLYQWFISQGGVGQCLPLKGATDEQLLVQQADITHHGRYCCRCTNPYMGETEEGRVAFSNWAMVTVAGVPVILKEPDPIQAVPIGADLILSVHAECHPAPPEYRWFRVSGGKETLLEGHREAVLKFRICRFDDAGEYFCVVGNPLLSGKQEGWRSSRMTIVRVLPPVVEGEQLDHGLGEVEDEESDGEGRFSYGRRMQQPESQTNSEHGMDHLGNDMQRIGYNNDRSPVDQQPSLCRPDALPLRFSEDQQSVVGDQSTHNYPTGCAPAGHTTQPFPSIPGDALPTPATEEGSINFTLQPKDMSVLEKESFTVHCKAETGSGRLMYQLYEMKVNGECSPVTSKTPREDIIVAEGLGGPNPEVTLFVRAFKESDNSVYLDSEHFKVQLKKAMFVAQPLGKVRGITGRDMMLMCRLATSDEHPPEITYQWYKGESLQSNDFKYLKGQTSSILRLSNLSPDDVGYYGCKVCVRGERSDMYYSKETYLTVGAEEDGEIVIAEQPVGEITVKCGGKLKLHVCAMSEVGEPLQFVWHKNGDALSGGGETLEIKPFTAADIGLYKCVVRGTISGKLVETNEVKVSCPAAPARALSHHKAEEYVKGKWRGKVAMLIANQNYSHFQKLQTAEEDVRMLAAELRRLGFSVLTLANLTLREMQEAQDIFCSRLLSKDATGVLAFVYFAGHGFVTECDSFEYLMPVDAKQLDPKHNINRTTFCGLLHSKSQFSKLFRITDCCRTRAPGDSGEQSPKRAPSSLASESDYYNLIDVKGCGYSRPAVESFLAKILQELMADHSLTLQELTSMIREKARSDESTIQRPQLTINMYGENQMKLSDEIDAEAYADYVENPKPDRECVENWKKLDPSGLPKDYALSLSNEEWKEKAEVKLTIEEVFSNVLRVTVCVERKDARTNDLTVSVDKEALRKQGEAEAVVCVDTETSARGNEHCVVVRDIQRLKSPLTLCIDLTDGAKRHIERYTLPVKPLYAALKPS